MDKYIDLDWQKLLDMLVEHTSAYTEMLSNKVFDEEEFDQCKLKLAEIHAAIKMKAEQDGHPMPNILPNFPDYIREAYHQSKL